jgi:ABC-2 type transport system ATP-binding protein
VDDVVRRFGAVEALRGISLEVAHGEVHALLGPNGAGKTTLMRILSGLVAPSAGSAYVLDRRAGQARELRGLVGLVPSGDRTFYLRISGLENLIFFARLHGLRRSAARQRALELLEAVGLADVAKRRVMEYSHGMQKRLSFARALLVEPAVLLVDEATHDLDPVAAQAIRRLTLERVRGGAAVLWTTQRIEELEGFADRVTVLERGTVCFQGSVSELIAMGGGERHVLRFGPATTATLAMLSGTLGDLGQLEPYQDGTHAMLTLAPGFAIGEAVSLLHAAGAEILSCRDERHPIERAFLAVTGVEAA